jgi:hypothetical protein
MGFRGGERCFDAEPLQLLDHFLRNGTIDPHATRGDTPLTEVSLKL